MWILNQPRDSRWWRLPLRFDSEDEAEEAIQPPRRSV